MLRQAVNRHDTTNSTAQARGVSGINTKSTENRDVLGPSPPSSLNGSQCTTFSVSKNPLKRTASQIDPPVKRSAASLSRTTSVLSQMHDDVFFDENDLSDDIDLDEEPIIPVNYPKLPVAPSQDSALDAGVVTYPELPPLPAKSPTKFTLGKSPSSAPIPWSSSPISHKMPPPQTVSKPPRNPPKFAVLDLVSPEKPKKRRNLPWSKERDAPQTPRISEKSAAKVEPSPPLWNKTASAIKQEQNALRQRNAQSKKAAERTAAKQGGQETKAVTKGKRGQNKVPRVFLSEEQKRVLDLVTEQKQSVFFTGSAGTGKSVLMREIIKVLRIKYAKEPERVAVTASTGLAACNVSGVTLHSFAGIGLGKEPAEELIKKIKKNQKARNRWIRAKVLVVDEISMVDGKLFDKLEKVARGLRNDGRPFGGIQLVVTGDFFQLPPVPDGGQEATFAFDAGTWPTVVQHTIGLTQVFRQKDPTFANMLNEMRVGKLSQSSISAFHKLHRQLSFEDRIEATELFPTREEVDRSNRTRMQQLQGKVFTFDANDGGTIQDTQQRDRLLSNCMAPQQIMLKKGAQVMLIKNLDDGLVNGSIGNVIAFMDERTYDLYLEDEDSFQPPDAVGMDEERLEASRNKIKANANKDGSAATSRVWPLVAFKLQDGTTRQLLCVQEKWTIELPNGEVQASRSQVPLILAWALSIHKAQGQTLERVKVDLGRVFEKGQAYVALSRATSQEGLQILNFNPKKVMAHDKVRKFYDSLYNIREAKVAPKPGPPTSKATNSWTGDGFDDESHYLEYANYA